MAYTYEPIIHFDETRHVAYSWLRSDRQEGPPVRVEVSRDVVNTSWRLNWIDRRAVADQFNRAKLEHLDAAANVIAPPGIKYRVYKVFDR
jgi:hypothetical protein